MKKIDNLHIILVCIMSLICTGKKSKAKFLNTIINSQNVVLSFYEKNMLVSEFLETTFPKVLANIIFKYSYDKYTVEIYNYQKYYKMYYDNVEYLIFLHNTMSCAKFCLAYIDPRIACEKILSCFNKFMKKEYGKSQYLQYYYYKNPLHTNGGCKKIFTCPKQKKRTAIIMRKLIDMLLIVRDTIQQ